MSFLFVFSLFLYSLFSLAQITHPYDYGDFGPQSLGMSRCPCNQPCSFFMIPQLLRMQTHVFNVTPQETSMIMRKQNDLMALNQEKMLSDSFWAGDFHSTAVYIEELEFYITLVVNDLGMLYYWQEKGKTVKKKIQFWPNSPIQEANRRAATQNNYFGFETDSRNSNRQSSDGCLQFGEGNETNVTRKYFEMKAIARENVLHVMIVTQNLKTSLVEGTTISFGISQKLNFELAYLNQTGIWFSETRPNGSVNCIRDLNFLIYKEELHMFYLVDQLVLMGSNGVDQSQVLLRSNSESDKIFTFGVFLDDTNLVNHKSKLRKNKSEYRSPSDNGERPKWNLTQKSQDNGFSESEEIGEMAQAPIGSSATFLAGKHKTPVPETIPYMLVTFENNISTYELYRPPNSSYILNMKYFSSHFFKFVSIWGQKTLMPQIFLGVSQISPIQFFANVTGSRVQYPNLKNYLGKERPIKECIDSSYLKTKELLTIIYTSNDGYHCLVPIVWHTNQVPFEGPDSSSGAPLNETAPKFRFECFPIIVPFNVSAGSSKMETISAEINDNYLIGLYKNASQMYLVHHIINLYFGSKKIENHQSLYLSAVYQEQIGFVFNTGAYIVINLTNSSQSLTPVNFSMNVKSILNLQMMTSDGVQQYELLFALPASKDRALPNLIQAAYTISEHVYYKETIWAAWENLNIFYVDFHDNLLPFVNSITINENFLFFLLEMTFCLVVAVGFIFQTSNAILWGVRRNTEKAKPTLKVKDEAELLSDAKTSSAKTDS